MWITATIETYQKKAMFNNFPFCYMVHIEQFAWKIAYFVTTSDLLISLDNWDFNNVDFKHRSKK